MKSKWTKLSIITGSAVILISMIGINKALLHTITSEKVNNISDKDDNAIAVDSSVAKLKNQLETLKGFKSDTNLFLCNKTVLLPKDYTPNEIVESNLPFISYIQTTKLNKTVANEARIMFNAAKKEGINLLGASGYRSHQVQKNLFESRVKAIGREEALKYSAPPGSSEHETGYAIDILSDTYPTLDSNFENTTACKWLFDNSYKYGFILRYPKDKVHITKYSYEPWHYRYVGKTHAKLIKENGYTLEEYLESIDNQIQVIETNLNED